ncbi:hypothetical protein [Sulfitobacter pacificus]|uniref:hypothetical protein n=1 Tax=Sulfitobacter pacificus TaxID=1499314 RepID=UPI00310A17DE
MQVTSAGKSDESFPKLIQFGKYAWPKTEAQQTLVHLVEKIKLGISFGSQEDAIDADTLKAVSDSAFEIAIREQLCAKLLAALDQEYCTWAKTETNKRSQRIFVHPPMEIDILTEWATRQDLPVVSSISRFSEVAAAPCIVVPKLERFLSRRQDRMPELFDLLSKLACYQGRILVGCNSWAMRFLEQFEDIRLLLGPGQVFPAFGADALAGILEAAVGDSVTLMSVSSGDSVFKRDDEGALCDPFLQELADSSLGHPWVAIEMLFQGLAEATDEDRATTDKRSWVQLPSACSLPNTGRDAILFALHSLLIHGPRKIEDFDGLVPMRLPKGIWAELDRNGFVDLKDGYVSCAIRNYPDIRRELSAAGFNLDRL